MIFKKRPKADENYSADYENRCGNCHAILKEDAKYCSVCGTERGKGKFLPADNEMYCVYGPPIETKLVCKKCGFSWVDSSLGRSKENYCPKCGNNELDKTERMEM